MDRAIDIYGERLGPGLWAEPLNAVTNLAFIFAGLALVAGLRRDAAARRDWAVVALVVLIFLVGIGSGLFHTFAVVWAALADVIPVGLFILLYMYLALYRFIALPLWGALAGVAVVLGLVVVMPAVFGFVWLISPAAVFLSGAGIAVLSLICATNVPRDPQEGNEVIRLRWNVAPARPVAAE